MTLVIPPGFAQASIVMRNTGDPEAWYVTLAIDTTDAGGDYEAAANSVAYAWQQNIMGSLNAATTFESVILRVGQDGGDPLSVYYAVGTTGEGTTAKLPQNCACLVRKNTTRGGRTGKGRMYVPNILSESEVDSVGVISGSFLSGLQSAFTDFLGDLVLGDPLPETPMVLLHTFGAPGGTTPTPVTSLTVDPVIATQRRRLRR